LKLPAEMLVMRGSTSDARIDELNFGISILIHCQYWFT